MTHKKDLLSYLVKTKDAFATVRQQEVEEGKEAKEYYCCFGCKKQYADKTRMRDHITTSAECIQKHKDFLRDIGFSRDEVDVEINNHLRETNRLLKNENFLLKQKLAEAQTTTVEDIQRDCLKAEHHIMRMEEAFSNLLYFLSEKDRKYIDAFHRSWKCEGIYDNTFIIQHRRKLLTLLKETPLLQMVLFPSWEFLRNNYHPSSGEYITFLSKHFERHFDYRPGDKLMGDPDERPPIPFANETAYSPPKEEKEPEPTPAPAPQPEQKQETVAPSIPIYTKSQTVQRSQSPYPRIINKTMSSK